jgi:DNA-binding PucR family transcriptional regulator
MNGVRLERLLDGIDGVLVDRLDPGGPGPLVTGIAILDPEDDSRDHHDELVLIIGARGRGALPLVRAAAAGGAAAVAVKGDGALSEDDGSENGGPGLGGTGLASAGAARGGAVSGGAVSGAAVRTAVLAVRPGVRWDQLVMLLRERLDVGELGADPDGRPGGPGPEGNDLFALAEHTAVATGGIVSIEDAGNRVLAYSRSDDDVDELRRLSILGWRGPESYLRMLRDWGVFDRLRATEQVVRVEEHPEFGIRPRLAVGIRAGARYLGTIWAQQRVTPFAPRAEEALTGAARLAAVEIVHRRTGSELGGSSRRGLLAELLTGSANTDLVAGRLGLDPASSALVIGFAAPPDGPARGPAVPEPPGQEQPAQDSPARELRREETLGLVALYASAHHRLALAGTVGDRVYAVLPGAGDRTPVGTWVRDAVELLRSSTGTRVCAGIGLEAPALAGLAEARSEADRVLDALLRPGARSGDRTHATIGELRAEVLLAEVLDLLDGRPELRHPGLESVAAYDARHGAELAASVLAHLDALGDVRAAAAALKVHPNTLRYRVRRVRELAGIDLDDPRERLACHLQLMALSRRTTHSGAG